MCTTYSKWFPKELLLVNIPRIDDMPAVMGNAVDKSAVYINILTWRAALLVAAAPSVEGHCVPHPPPRCLFG
jgi:hypothetical protein